MKKRTTTLQAFVFEAGKEKEVLLRLERFCAYTERCQSDVLKKLRSWKVPAEMYGTFLDALKEEKFLDQQRYSESFVRGKFKLKGWGRVKIKAELQAKSVPEPQVNEALAQLNEGILKEKLSQILQKKHQQLKEQDPSKRRQKLFRFGAQKGYESALISQVLREMQINGDQEPDESFE